MKIRGGIGLVGGPRDARLMEERLFLRIAPHQFIVSSCMQSVAGGPLLTPLLHWLRYAVYVYNTAAVERAQWTRNLSFVLGGGECL